jgi:hypothetical protein
MTAKPPIDLFTSFARFGREQKISLRDPNAAAAFAAMVGESLTAALDNDALLHGQRTQNMFEALIVGLGQYKLLKSEDTGLVHPRGQYTAPDFRVILKDDTHWLVEVKNVYDRDPSRQRYRIRESDLTKLKRYAGATHASLKLALYWARWGQWTLIDPDHLARTGDKFTIDMFKAARVNELARLGDVTIGTTPPLKFRRLVDKSKPRTIGPKSEVALTFAGGAFYCGGAEITDPVEQSIAWIFIRFGNWICEGPQALLSGREVDAIDLVWEPRERANEHERFEIIGSLSSMFSRHYALQTLAEDGVVQTEAEHIPDWFAPLIARDHASDALPLWRFYLQPVDTSSEASGEGPAPRRGDTDRGRETNSAPPKMRFTKEEVLAALDREENCYRLAILSTHWLRDTAHYQPSAADEARGFRMQAGEQWIAFADLADQLGDPLAREVLSSDLLLTHLHALIRGPFELLSDYCEDYDKVLFSGRLREQMQATGWYAFTRMIRNAVSHNFHFDFSERDRRRLPLSWNGVTLTEDMHGRPITYEALWHKPGYELFREMRAFAEALPEPPAP